MENVSKRVTLTKANFKKVKIAAEMLEIEKKEKEAIDDVINKAVEYFFEEKIALQLVEMMSKETTYPVEKNIEEDK